LRFLKYIFPVDFLTWIYVFEILWSDFAENWFHFRVEFFDLPRLVSFTGVTTVLTSRHHVVTPTVHTATTLTITVAIPNALNACRYGLNCLGAARTTDGISCSNVNLVRRMGFNLTVPSSVVLMQCTLQDQMSQWIDRQEAIHLASCRCSLSS
jgi:hypothetical protein